MDTPEENLEKICPGLTEKIFEQFYGDAEHNILIRNEIPLDREGANYRFDAQYEDKNKLIWLSCQDGNWGGSEILYFEVEYKYSDVIRGQRAKAFFVDDGTMNKYLSREETEKIESQFISDKLKQEIKEWEITESEARNIFMDSLNSCPHCGGQMETIIGSFRMCKVCKK